jgi:hypothetical protein
VIDKRRVPRSLLVVSLVALAQSCACEEPVAEPPVEPTRPAGFEGGAGPIHEIDRETEEHDGVLLNAPEGARLWGRMSSPGGKRTLYFVPAAGAGQVTAYESAWVSPPAGRFVDDGRALLCWNELTGPESAPGAMPHPSTGLALVCRLWDGGALGEPLQGAADDEPSWLQTIDEHSSGWLVRYYRNPSGWLVGEPTEEDKLLQRVFDGSSFGAVEDQPGAR